MIRVLKEIQAQEAFFEALAIRGNMDTGVYATQTKAIVEAVRTRGDEALFAYTNEWDHEAVTPETVKVSRETMRLAYEGLEAVLRSTLEHAAARIRAFHEKQKQQTWLDIKPNGEMLGQRVMPLNSCGVYVPGGKASYPSSVLMNVIPAKVAGVKKIVMVTPRTRKQQGEWPIPQNVLAAAYIAGVEELYTIGGAQAVAALAFGTETIPKVDKIVGPGNIYVALAKREVYGYVSIDSIAGPSEILVLADDSADPTFVAADLLSQAEHDELASAVLITPSEGLADAVQKEVTRLMAGLPRTHMLSSSLTHYSAILVVADIESACRIANRIAPEHLELAVEKPFDLLPQIEHAGAIFMGHYTPEPVGDYMAGPNHVLPTSGTARFFSPLGVDDFVKKSSLLAFSKEALMALSDEIMCFAASEQLDAHALAIKVRKEKAEDVTTY